MLSCFKNIFYLFFDIFIHLYSVSWSYSPPTSRLTSEVHSPTHAFPPRSLIFILLPFFFIFLAVHWFQLVPSAALLADLISLVLCRSPRLQGVHECIYHVTTRRQCLSNLLLHLALTFFPNSLPPRVPILGLFNRCPILGWELHRHLFVAPFWGEEDLCINCCPEQKELLWPTLRVALNYRQNHD